MSEDRVAYFISDLHLTLGRPELCAAFFNFLPSMAKDATDLFILGDFFNFWVGDDIQSPLTRQISDALAKLADQNIRIYFQHGNRDFAVGEHYARECHMEILPEIYSVPFIPKTILLHGDQLCLDDVKYQRYRRIIRHPIVMKILHCLPKSWRYRLGLRLREASKRAQRNRSSADDYSYSNVTAHAVEDVFKQYSASTMIHGHTHRPNVHQHTNGKRWVLSDWEASADYIKWDAHNGFVRHTFIIPPVE